MARNASPPRRRRRLEHRHRGSIAARASSSSTRPCAAFLEENPDDAVTVVVDATFGHRIDACERDAFEAAVDANELRRPAGRRHRPRRRVRAADRRQGRRDGAVERLLPGVPRRVRLAVRRGPPDRRQAGARRRLGVRVAHAGRAGPSQPPGEAGRQAERRRRRPTTERPRARTKAASRRVHRRRSRLPMPRPRSRAASPGKRRGAAGRRPAGAAAVDRKRGGGLGAPSTERSLPFLEFVAQPPVGLAPSMATVDGSRRTGLTSMSDVGALLRPASLPGKPAPRSAPRGARVGRRCRSPFVVHRRPARRGVDLAHARCRSPMVSCRPRQRPARRPRRRRRRRAPRRRRR